MDWAKTTSRRDKNDLGFGIWCNLYKRFYSLLPFILYTGSMNTTYKYTAMVDNKSQYNFI